MLKSDSQQVTTQLVRFGFVKLLCWPSQQELCLPVCDINLNIGHLSIQYLHNVHNGDLFNLYDHTCYVSCYQWLPESPRFDIARGMPDRAMATLERVARENGKPMPLGKLVDVVAEVCSSSADCHSKTANRSCLGFIFLYFVNCGTVYEVSLNVLLLCFKYNFYLSLICQSASLALW